MWRDELMVWAVAADNSFIGAVGHTVRYMGHMLLWTVCLHGLSAISHDPRIMQVLTLLVTTLSAIVFWLFAPFGRWQRILFAFGYFPFFEYGVLSRDYVLELCGLICLCAVYSRSPRRYLLMAACGLVVVQGSMHGVLVAVSVAVAVILDGIRRAREDPASVPSRRYVAGAAALFGAGTLASVVAVHAPPGFDAWYLAFDPPRLAYCLAIPWRALVPIPGTLVHFWGTNFLDAVPGGFAIQAGLGVGLLATCVGVLLRRPAACLLFVLGTFPLLAACYLKYLGNLRHHGHLFLLLVAACWMASSTPSWKLRGIWETIAEWGERARPHFLTAVLVAQLVGGLEATAADFLVPFSASRDTAAWLRQKGLDRRPIVGDLETMTLPVGILLGRPIYLAESHREGTFVIWDQPGRPVTTQEVLDELRQQVEAHHSDAVLLLNYRLPYEVPGLQPLASFENSTIPEERYYVYLARVPR